MLPLRLPNLTDRRFPAVHRMALAAVAAAGLAGICIGAIASVNRTASLPVDAQVADQIMLIHAQQATAQDAGRAHALATGIQAMPFALRASWPADGTGDDGLAVNDDGILAELSGITDISTHVAGIDREITPPSAADLALRQISVLPKSRSQSSWQCLTQAIYFEARGEPVIGQRAVAEVILNRVDNRRWPSTLCEVVRQGAHRRHKCQFSYYCDGVPERVTDWRAWGRAKEIAREALATKDRPLTKGATHYHATSVSPVWARKLTLTARYGTHIFYRNSTRVSRR